MKANVDGVDVAMQGLDLSTQTTPIKSVVDQFIHFSQLPAELRIQIWESTFVSRRIMLKRHSHRPRLTNIEGTLLIVNRETRRIFLEHYTLAFDRPGQPGIYINHSLDKLFLNCNIKSLRLLLKQFPATMRQIQRLEIRNCSQL
jgi:2EXR family